MSEIPEKSIDLLWGAEAIAAAIGLDRRQTFHLLSHGRIPARKVGERWVASRRKLEEFFSGEPA